MAALFQVFLSVAPLLTGDTLAVPLEHAWTSTTSTQWVSRVDHRDLLAMRHPWVPSEEKGFALYSISIRVPKDWNESVALTFYCGDDYHTDAWRPDGSWLTASGFIGHRYKRVLINGDVVWQADVADPVVPGKSPRYTIPLEVEAGQVIQLGLLVYDSVPSTTVLPHDFYQSANGTLKRESDEDAENFYTTVYWGDITLVHNGAEPEQGERPVVQQIKTQHEKRWPLPHFGDGWTEKTVALKLDTVVDVPKVGFPVTAGIPFPVKQLDDIKNVRLQTADEKALYSEKMILGQWPDDSIRWVLFDFIAKPGQSRIDLAFTKDQARTTSKLGTTNKDETLVQKNSMLEYVTRQGEHPGSLWHKKKELFNHFSINLVSHGESYQGICRAPEVDYENTLQSTVLQKGCL